MFYTIQCSIESHVFFKVFIKVKNGVHVSLNRVNVISKFKAVPPCLSVLCRNQQFEQNVQTSLKTVDDLKKSLNFDGVGKGFENIESASRAVSFSGIGNSLEEVKLKFSSPCEVA